jgi:hypothetical protein
MTLRTSAPHAKQRWMLLATAVLALTALAIGITLASIPSSFFVVKDQQGANDVPAQSDLTQMGRDDTSDSTKYKLFWSWDSTDQWTGTGQTGDACALFDSDADGNINTVVCGQVNNPNADPSVVQQTTASPYFFSCGDKKNDRCTTPSPLSYSSGQILAGVLGSPSNRNGNLITNTDPFPLVGSNTPNDSTLEVDIAKSLLPAGSVLVNVCSYPSAGNGGNNNPFDCITTPGGGLLTITKNVAGGTSQTFTFNVSPAPPAPQASSYQLTPTSGTASTDPIGIGITSSQSVSETIPGGWTLSSASCSVEGASGTTGSANLTTGVISGITIASGKNTTCTFNDAPLPGTIIVKKVVINDNGGTKAATDFSFSFDANATSTAFLQDPDNNPLHGKNTLSKSAGSYSITEPPVSGYTTTYDNCSFTLTNGGNQTCTITNDDQAGTLIVKKVVINDNGGTKVATDFSFSLDANATSTAFLQDPDNNPLHGKNTLSKSAGTYNITEPAVSGYSTSYTNCSNVSLANGGTQTCTITNDDVKASPGIGTTMNWTLNDSVTLSSFRTGGTGGTATFYLYKNDNTCSVAGNLVFSQTVNVDNSTGTAATTTGYTTSATGTYYWFVTYSGNNFNDANPGTGTCGAEVTTLP